MALCTALATDDFPHGVVLFCGDDLAEALHPVVPVSQPAFLCNTDFDTSSILQALQQRREQTCGVVVIDGDQATLGNFVSSGGGSTKSKVAKVARITSNIASRTRRGGSSAARLSRNRDIEELSFLRKVAAKLLEHFGDLSRIVIGGRADMKKKLVAELPSNVQTTLAPLVDLNHHADEDGLHAMLQHAQAAIQGLKSHNTNVIVEHFMESVSRPDCDDSTFACYGVTQTKAALRLGAVQDLIVAATSNATSMIFKPDWKALASAVGANYLEVYPKSETGVHFCEGFGVGACLRYAVSNSLLEDNENEDAPELADEVVSAGKDQPSSHEVESESDTNSTAPSQSDGLLKTWLVQALTTAFQDTAAAECLAIGADLIISDDSSSVEERLDAVVDMLRGEGVPEDVLSELNCHLCDHFDMDIA